MPANNESLGMSVEYLICEAVGLPSAHLADRAHPPYCEKMRPVVEKAVGDFPRVTEHVGGSSDVDFTTVDGTLSVKTNLKITGAKVAPQRCGQPSDVTYTQFFRDFYKDHELENGVVPRPVLKRRVQERTAEMMNIYVDNLLDCDHTFWAWMNPQPDYRVIHKRELLRAEWDQERFSFTKTPQRWNESCTVKYTPPGSAVAVSIGEFQIHNNRNNYKFRFTMRNLLDLIAPR